MATDIKYNTASPYKLTPYIEGKFLDILAIREISAEADDLYRQIGIQYQYRPDLLSWWVYDTTQYWWVFMMRNRDIIIDPIWDFSADKYIYIPKKDTLIHNLGI